MKTITLVELTEALEAGETITLVETLRLPAYDRGHLPGALHLHSDDVERLADTLLPDRDAMIVTYCSNVACRASTAVHAKLLRRGYVNVATFAGGKQEWVDAGLPLEHGTTTRIDPVPDCAA